jgi:hypothetical protein
MHWPLRTGQRVAYHQGLICSSTKMYTHNMAALPHHMVQSAAGPVRHNLRSSEPALVSSRACGVAHCYYNYYFAQFCTQSAPPEDAHVRALIPEGLLLARGYFLLRQALCPLILLGLCTSH